MKRTTFCLVTLLVVSGFFYSCDEEEQRIYRCVDYDGNSYETVVIGDQVWMAENLKAIHSTNGATNYLTSELTNWVFKDVGKRFFLDNDSLYRDIYGYMYNYRAIETGKLAPRNWRIPSMEDWETLFSFVKSQKYGYEPSATSDWIGKALASKTIWSQSTIEGSVGYNLSINNITGFNALPGGYRTSDELYKGEKRRACFWTSTMDSTTNRPVVVYITQNSIEFQVDTFMTNDEACYVRCVRDVQ